jgi:hypothetical protein
VFDEWAAMASEGGAMLQPVADRLEQASHQLGQPMRLAVVGQIKRGKSTLVNALLGEEIAATGQLELTFTVSEFRYAKDRSVFVHFKDGSHKGPLPPKSLDSLTIRNPAMIEELRKIRTVEFTMPNDLLHTFHLIDTPGLGSIHRVDAQNTNEFLGVSAAFGDAGERAAMEQTLTAMGRTASDVHDDSKKELDLADAILYLFSRGLNEGDHSVVTQFLGAASGSITPLRAFAVLSRCDQYWPPDRDLPGSPNLLTYDPMVAANTIIDRYLSDPGVRRLFYTIVPVSGLVGIGACLLTDDEICWLDELRAVEPNLLARRLRDAARFATETDLSGIALPGAARRRLIDRLGNWGTLRACGYLRDGATASQMRDHLVDDSGVTRLRDLIGSHFGNRASVIKLSRGIQDATAEIGQCRLRFQRAGQPVPELIDLIAEQIEQLRIGEHTTAAELSVLSDLYNDELTLSDDEKAEILTVTGEHGTSCAARLGHPEETPLPQLAEAAARQAERWASKEQDPALNRPTLRAARTMRRSYDRLAYQISQDGHPPVGIDES